MFVCRSQATCLLYHMFVSLSTIIFVFFKTFQIVCSEETIPCDMATIPFIPTEFKYEVIPDVSKQFKIVAGLDRKSVV